MNHDAAVLVASVIISVIGALAGWASQKTAAKATIASASVESRTSMETDAYERARKFDTDTITRQDNEINDLREENKAQALQIRTLTEDNQSLRQQVRDLLDRVAHLEQKNPH